MLVLPRSIERALNMTVELSQHADARYDCNQILGGGDDVVTRSHENLLSTVRGTSRCKPGFGRASMPSFNNQRQSNPVSLGRESLEHCWSRPLFCSRFWLRLFAIWNGHRTPIMPNL
jgi:hypothetical protein